MLRLRPGSAEEVVASLERNRWGDTHMGRKVDLGLSTNGCERVGVRSHAEGMAQFFADFRQSEEDVPTSRRRAAIVWE